MKKSGVKYPTGKKLKIATCIIGLILMGFLIAAFFSLLGKPSKERMTDFNEGWNISCGGQVYKGVNLMDFRVPQRLKRGDFIVLHNNLPKKLDNGSAVVFPVQLSTVSIAVKGNIIYGYGTEEFSAGDMVGSAVHLARLPDDSQGLPITIVLTAGEDGAFSFFSGIVLDKTTAAFPDYLNFNIVLFLLSASLMVAGMIFIIITGFVAYKGLGWLRMSQTGMLCFTVGCWTLCEIEAIQLFSMDYHWNTVMRYAFAAFAIIPMVRIISSANEDAGIRNILKEAVFYLDQLLIFTILFLCFKGKMHICNARQIFQVVGVISIAAVFFVEWYKRDSVTLRSPRIREQAVALIFIVAEIMRYMVYSKGHFHNAFMQHSIIPYGTLLFVMMMIGSYIYELYLSYVKQAEEKSLKKLAYTDGLTGLLNRAFCKDRLEELDNDDKNYHIISFDVDGLKEINDSKGHLAGDRLLVAFARILEKCFSDVGNVIRPGGDEFLVISDDAGTQELMSRLSWLESVERSEGKRLGFPVHAAYGMAANDEVPGHTTEEVYNLADRRMYEMKKRGKK